MTYLFIMLAFGVVLIAALFIVVCTVAVVTEIIWRKIYKLLTKGYYDLW